MNRRLTLAVVAGVLAMVAWTVFPRRPSLDKVAESTFLGESQDEVATALAGHGELVVKGDDEASYLIVTRPQMFDSLLGATSYDCVTFEFRNRRLVSAFAIEKRPLGSEQPRPLALPSPSRP